MCYNIIVYHTYTDTHIENTVWPNKIMRRFSSYITLQHMGAHHIITENSRSANPPSRKVKIELFSIPPKRSGYIQWIGTHDYRGGGKCLYTKLVSARQTSLCQNVICCKMTKVSLIYRCL